MSPQVDQGAAPRFAQSPWAQGQVRMVRAGGELSQAPSRALFSLNGSIDLQDQITNPSGHEPTWNPALPAVSPLTPKEILFLSRAADSSSVLMLGFLEQRVTFYPQQVRALNLADALAQEGHLKPRARIAVIGGGAAGMSGGELHPPSVRGGQHPVPDIRAARGRGQRRGFRCGLSPRGSTDTGSQLWASRTGTIGLEGHHRQKWSSHGSSEASLCILSSPSPRRPAPALNTMLTRDCPSLQW